MSHEPVRAVAVKLDADSKARIKRLAEARPPECQA